MHPTYLLCVFVCTYEHVQICLYVLRFVCLHIIVPLLCVCVCVCVCVFVCVCVSNRMYVIRLPSIGEKMRWQGLFESSDFYVCSLWFV